MMGTGKGGEGGRGDDWKEEKGAKRCDGAYRRESYCRRMVLPVGGCACVVVLVLCDKVKENENATKKGG